MVQKSYLWDGSIDAGDTGDVGPYNEETWRDINRALHGGAASNDVGVVPDSGPSGVLPLFVRPSTPASRSVTITAGFALINGTVYESTAEEEITITQNNDSDSRVDTIALRWHETDSTIRLFYIAGAPASNPQPGALSNTSSIKDIPLAYVTLAPSYTSVSNSNIRYVGRYLQTGSLNIQVFRNNDLVPILSGRAVEVDSRNNRSVRLCRSTNNFLGVAIGDIATGEYGFICTDGIAPVYFTSSITRGRHLQQSGIFGILNETSGILGTNLVTSLGITLESSTEAGHYQSWINTKTIQRNVLALAQYETAQNEAPVGPSSSTPTHPELTHTITTLTGRVRCVMTFESRRNTTVSVKMTLDDDVAESRAWSTLPRITVEHIFEGVSDGTHTFRVEYVSGDERIHVYYFVAQELP